MDPRAGRVLRVAIGVVAFAAVVVAFAQTWDRSQGSALPSWPSFVGAGAFICVGLVCGAQGWLHLLERSGSRKLAATFYLSQIGKYIPGAIWQPAGQLTMAISSGVPAAEASTAVAVYMLALIAAGGTVGLGLVATGTGTFRYLALLGVVPILLIRRSWMAGALNRIHRRFERIPDGSVVPRQRAIVISYAWGLAVMVTTGTAFFILTRDLSDAVSLGAAVTAFAFAWTVGFVAVPVPAGLGIREAVLVGALAIEPGAALAASIAYRLTSIGAEVLVVAITRIGARGHPHEQ